jgi:hypothetical protein
MLAEEPETHFLNVDLDIFSKSELGPLVASLGDSVFVHYLGREKRLYSAHISLSRTRKQADFLIREFARLIKSLPRPARKLWDSAISRTFNIGIQAGKRPESFETSLTQATIRRISALEATIAVTIYGSNVLMVSVKKKGEIDNAI